MLRIRRWSLRRDERSHVLIGTGGTWRSDWPEREKRSITRGLAAVCTRLLQALHLVLVVTMKSVIFLQLVSSCIKPHERFDVKISS